MDAGHDRYSSPSSDHEPDTGPDHHNDDTASKGTCTVTSTVAPRSYDCMYCKRGFTTAQALGGHMNIHRRDRARTVGGPIASTREYTPPSSPLHHAGAGPVISMAAPVVVHGDAYPPYHVVAGSRAPFFSSATEPAFPVYRHLPVSSTSSSAMLASSGEEHRRREGKQEMDPEKLRELMRYGKDLELGINKSTYGDHIDDAVEDGRAKGDSCGKLDLSLSL